MPRFLGLWLPDIQSHHVSPPKTNFTKLLLLSLKPLRPVHHGTGSKSIKKQESTNEGPVPSNCAVHLTNLEPARPASRGNLPGGDILSSTGLMCRIQGFFLILQFTKSVVAVLTNDKTSTDFKVIRP